MASIIQLNGKWRAQVRRKGLPTSTKTFDTKGEAERWAKGLEKGAVAARGATTVATSATKTWLLRDLISDYRTLREQAKRPIDPVANEHYVLSMLSERLGHLDVHRMTPTDLVEYASKRIEEASPATINMDISKLGTVLRHTASIKSLPFNDVVGAARPLLNHLHLIAGGNQRVRRPNADELTRLFEYFRQHVDRTHLRMEDIVRAAITMGLRRGELFRVVWSDLDRDKKLLLVRDRKHPRQKKGNDQWVPLIGDAWEIVERQPRTEDPRIFPFNRQTVSKYFKTACDALGIPDLHFHDMRREAASSLLEAGWSDRDVKMVTGHSSKVFEVYAKPDPAMLHTRPVPKTKVPKKV